MEWIPALEYSTYCQACVGTCRHILSRQALNVFASRDPDAGRAYLVLETPDEATRYPDPSRAAEGGGAGQQVVKSCFPMTIIMREGSGADCDELLTC
jgi:hypothetical protein